MKQKLLRFSFLSVFVLLFTSGAWADDSYTITFGSSANGNTQLAATTKATTVISAGTDYVTSKPFTINSGNCYYGDNKQSIRLSKQNNAAKLTIALSDEGKVKATSIVVNCFKFSDSYKGTLKVNGMTAQNVPTTSADDLTFTFASSTDIESIVLETTKATFIYSITVNYTTGGGGTTVAAPTFDTAAGNYFATQTVKVSNYDDDLLYFYTTDGSAPNCDEGLDPTGTSEAYNHTTGISITTTTTLKMIAVDIDGNKSSVASATYTFPTVYTTIAAFKAANTTGYLDLTGAQVVFIDNAKKNIYVRDASGAIDLFNNSGFNTTLTTGDILSGIINGKYSPYKNLPEITNIADISVLTATSNETVIAKEIDPNDIDDNLCDLVKITNTEISKSGDKYYIADGDIQLYDNFSVGYTATEGKTVDVSGIAVVYNTTYEIFPRFTTDIVYLDNSVAVSIGDAGIATFCSTEALDFTGVDAIEVYTAKVNGTKVELTPINKVPAEEGVILINAAGLGSAVAAINVPVLSGEADDVTDNELVGITAATNVAWNVGSNYNYILQLDGATPKFFKAAESGAELAANRAYLSTTTTPAAARSLTINFGDATAIEGIDAISAQKVIRKVMKNGRVVIETSEGTFSLDGARIK